MNNIKTKIGRSKVYLMYKRAVIFLLSFLPVINNKIVFDNFGGRGFGDDPKYIALKLLDSSNKYKIYWVTRNTDTYLPTGIKPVKYGTIRAAYHWATAKVWVDNIKSSSKVRKKENQYYIQTWHSTLGFKKNEDDANTLDEKYVMLAKKDALYTDLMYSDNDFRLDKYKNRFWYSGPVIKCDVPRMSIMINSIPQIEEKVYNYFGIDKSNKIIIYAPTFRKRMDLSCYLFDYKHIINMMGEKFGGDFVLLIRLHPNEAEHSNKLIEYDNEKIYNASAYDDMQELLSVADVLITDYSGCMFDFGLVGKPVFLLAKDLKWYSTKDRDLYFQLDDVPYSLSQTDNELVDNIASFDYESYNNKCDAFKEKIGYSDSGQGDYFISRIIYDIVYGDRDLSFE